MQTSTNTRAVSPGTAFGGQPEAAFATETGSALAAAVTRRPTNHDHVRL
jgi:hypothetical protein